MPVSSPAAALRWLTLTALFVTLAAPLHSQLIEAPRRSGTDQWIFGFSGFGGIPVGDFRKNENGGGGLDVVVGYQPFRREPLVFRGQGGFLIYGRINRDIEDDWCDLTGCYNEVVYYDSRNHWMMYFHVGPEIMATAGKWRPFATAGAGLTHFNSWANLGYPDNTGSPPSTRLFASANFSSSYGVGVRLVDPASERPGAFELSVRFTRNAKADYLTDRGVQLQPNGTWVIAPLRGAANVLSIHLGFWIGPRLHWDER